MAKIDFPPDSPDFFAAASANAASANAARKPPLKGRRSKRASRTGEASFSSALEQAAGAGIEAQAALPVSAETVNRLMEDVRAAGDVLRERPFPQEILGYKQAVRNFIHYVVENGYQVEDDQGIPNYLRPGFTGSRGSPNSQARKLYHSVQVVDHRLEELAAVLMRGQISQLELLSRLEEIKGLLINLMS
ncbi:MAG: YaaR family protein [Treponema sp.]|jgi:uncharacterized protein YaaR (DUF327 family)|nr:YaaR family protein [Treponema sp.]